MNIGIFTDTYYPEVNGVANSAYELKRGLEALGHKVYVFTVTNPTVKRGSEHNVIRVASVPFVLMRERRLGCPIYRYVKKRIKRLKLDVIHTQTEFAMGHLGRRMAEYMNIPHIHTYHTIYEDYTHYLKIPGNTGFKGVIRRFSRHCCEKADLVIVPTDKVEMLLREYRVDKKIKVIPTGINLAKFLGADKQKTAALKEKYGLADKNALIYTGRLSKEKGIDELIGYCAELFKEKDDTVLVIVGGGPQDEELKKLSQRYEIEDRVIFTGMVSWDEIENYYALGDIFVSASTSETQGLTYGEALAAGLPLLVKRDGCLNSILKEGVNGYDFTDFQSFKEGYCRLIEKKDSLGFKERLHSSAASIGADIFAAKMEQAYKEVIEQN